MILSLVRNPPFLSHQNCCKTIYPPCNTLCVWAPDYPRTSSTIKSFFLFFQAIRPKLSLLLLPSSISCCDIPSSRSLIFSTSSASNAWIYKVLAGLFLDPVLLLLRQQQQQRLLLFPRSFLPSFTLHSSKFSSSRDRRHLIPKHCISWCSWS